jgi:hypothetical protein
MGGTRTYSPGVYGDFPPKSLKSVDFAYIPADQVQRAVGLLRIPDRFLRQEHVVGPAVHNTNRGLVRTGILIS